MRHWTDVITESNKGLDERQLKRDVSAIFNSMYRQKVRAGRAAFSSLEDLAYNGMIKDEKIKVSQDTMDLLKWAIAKPEFKSRMMLYLKSMNRSVALLKQAALAMVDELPKYGQGHLHPDRQ